MKEKQGATFNKDDQAKYVGMGWISVEKVDGVRKFIGNVLYKVSFRTVGGLQHKR